MQTKEQRQIKRNLLNLLRLLGVKSSTHAGAVTLDDINDLMDAIKAGYGSPTTIYTSPLQMESLETTLKSVRFDNL